jgi:glucose dehydrogenase
VVHNVVYVATEGNTIYAIDASSGQILLNPNFGNPVPLPLGCSNNGPNEGINGTPVIDRETHTMYVIIYTLESGTPVYRIHALDLSTLTDKEWPVVMSASHKLSNNTMFQFSARYQRQRPALLLSKGNAYAGFGSFCDFAANVSRGGLLGKKTHFHH